MQAVDRLNAALEGRYRVERELGEGGMATVYLADDLRHERKVALKVLKPELAAVVGAERFLAEIKTTANLQHPHILPLFDSGEADSFLFYVMPYVKGESLRERLERAHQLPVDTAVQIAKNVAEALDYAHRQGVIHRDIKPANILLQDGKPVVSDFGIALALGAAGAGRLTETGLSLGTPHYMSPEQATGDLSVGPAADIYALGCVLYEMLVGEPPYTGGTPQAVLGKIVTGDAPSASAGRKSVPPNVDATIRKALEKVPADRFASASDFARVLGDPGFRHGTMAASLGAAASAGPWNRLSTALAASSVVLALGLTWSLLRPPAVASPPGVERFPLAYDITRMGLPALLPDGSGMVYGLGQLMVRRWGSLDPMPVSGAEDVGPVGQVAVSPSSDEVAFITSAGELKVASLAGGLVRTLAAPVACCAQWGSDGFVYFSARSGNIQRVAAKGGAIEDVTTPDPPVFSRGYQLLPGGRVAVFSSTSAPGSVVEATRLSTGERRVLTPGMAPVVTPTGYLVFGSPEGQILAAPLDADAMELTRPAVPVVEGVLVVPGPVPDFSLSDDGSLIYAEGAGRGASRLAIVDLHGNQEVLPLAPRELSDIGPSWSPDGESVVFSSEDQIYTYDVVRNTTPRQLTFEGVNARPVFSPDGNRVAFSSIREGTDGYDLFVKNLGQDAPPHAFVRLDGNQLMMGWPADTLIVFERGDNGNRDLWLLDLSDPDLPEARPYLTSEADLERIAVSPDGRLAAYRSNETGIDEIYVRSFPDPGERTLVSRGGGQVPFWSPDGATLYYEVGLARPLVAAHLQRDPVPAVLSVDTLFGVVNVSSDPFPGRALHPDGDRFIFAIPSFGSATGEVAQRLILVKNFFGELDRLVPRD